MKYIEKNLLPDEKLLYQTQRHWIIFFLPMLMTILSVFLLMQKELLILLGYLTLLFAAVMWLSSLVTYLTSEFGVTNRRVLVKLGFIRRQSWETLLQKIAGIEVHQTIFGRIFGYGTIIVQSTGGNKDPFHGIDDPLSFRRKIQEQIEKCGSPLGCSDE